MLIVRDDRDRPLRNRQFSFYQRHRIIFTAIAVFEQILIDIINTDVFPLVAAVESNFVTKNQLQAAGAVGKSKFRIQFAVHFPLIVGDDGNRPRRHLDRGLRIVQRLPVVIAVDFDADIHFADFYPGQFLAVDDDD